MQRNLESETQDRANRLYDQVVSAFLSIENADISTLRLLHDRMEVEPIIAAYPRNKKKLFYQIAEIIEDEIEMREITNEITEKDREEIKKKRWNFIEEIVSSWGG